MALFNTDNKVVIGLICIFSSLFYVMPFISSIEGKNYHEEFKKTEFDELSIEMYRNFTDEIVETKITDRNELEFYYNLFANKLEYGQIKEKKLYHYSVTVSFYNSKDKCKYIFDVFFDNKKILTRPVLLLERGDEQGYNGYSFALNDEEFEFYQKMMEIWETSEKSRL